MKVKLKYITKLRTERVDSNQKKLTEDFIITEIRKGIPRVWTAPAGLLSDGKSVPPELTPLIGDPFEGVTEPAAWIHDQYCITKERSQKDTHRIFRDLVYHEMRRNTKYGWLRWPWNMHNSKLWQYQRCKIMWLAVRVWNRLKHPEWK